MAGGIAIPDGLGNSSKSALFPMERKGTMSMNRSMAATSLSSKQSIAQAGLGGKQCKGPKGQKEEKRAGKKQKENGDCVIF